MITISAIIISGGQYNTKQIAIMLVQLIFTLLKRHHVKTHFFTLKAQFEFVYLVTQHSHRVKNRILKWPRFPSTLFIKSILSFQILFRMAKPQPTLIIEQI